MANRKHTCFTAVCDICGSELEVGDGVRHYEDPEWAAEDARDYEWATTEDAERAVCPAEDDAHRAAHAEVLAEYEAQEAARTPATPTS